MLTYNFSTEYLVQSIKLKKLNTDYLRLDTIKILRWLLQQGSPLPIPNREVKLVSADGTAFVGE